MELKAIEILKEYKNILEAYDGIDGAKEVEKAIAELEALQAKHNKVVAYCEEQTSLVSVGGYGLGCVDTSRHILNKLKA